MIINNFFKPFIALIKDGVVPRDIIFFSFLVILLPIALITGPAIPDIFLSLIALYFLLKSIFKKLWSYYRSPIVYGFLLFSLYGVIRSVFSDIPIESLTNEGSVFYFRYIFFALGVWYLLDHNPYLSKCLLYVIIICVLFVSFDGLYQYFMGTNFFGNQKYQAWRLTGMFGDEPIIGRYISYISIFGFALIYQTFTPSKPMMILSIVFLVIVEVIVFLSGERSPLFYLTLFSIFILVYIPKFRLYRIIGFLASILIIFSIIQLNPTAKQRMVNQTVSQMSETTLPFIPYSELHERHYVVALKMFQESPIVGMGTNTFRFQCEKEQFQYKPGSCTSHPHNYYFQVLAELGLIGFVFILIFVGFFLFVGLKQLYFILKDQKEQLIPFEQFLFFMIIFVYWWPLIPHMSLYNNWNNVLLMLPLGYLLRYLSNNKIITNGHLQ
ncbi:O-antigen ligase family protein [Alphaproteobacteria bacterium]|nr:O-antigen ligase family protein [Alphaproteobacteria bacterium]